MPSVSSRSCESKRSVDIENFVLRSSGIKEVALFGGDISEMVPPIVEKKLVARVRERSQQPNTQG